MGYRFRKQIIIILIIVLILAVIATLVYFAYFRVLPTCFDGKQNQSEEGVDCGGSCISCERLTIRDLGALWVKYLPLEKNRYYLVAMVVNPNPNFGLGQFSYSFVFYDSAGHQTGEQKGKDFILPNQNKYLIAGNVDVGQNFSRVELKINKPSKADWQKFSSEYQLPSIYVQDKQFKYLEDQPGVAQASGTMKNDSAFDFDKISVSIILFNADKQIIAVNRAEAHAVLTGEARYFSAMWSTPINGQVASMDIQAETNLLSDANFMRKYGIPEKFQEYQATPSDNTSY